MKRAEALSPLSRDHHKALYQALQLKRAGETGATEALRGVIEFFDTHGALHFRIEEELLLPRFVHDGGADPANDTIVRVLTDHVWIRARILALREAANVDIDELRELGERLDDHVRHEERSLFPAIEKALSPDQLAKLGRSIAIAEGESG